MTLRTCDSSLPTSAAICCGLIRVADAHTINARSRLTSDAALRESRLSRLPSSGNRSLTNTDGGRITTSRLGMRPTSPRDGSFRSTDTKRTTRRQSRLPGRRPQAAQAQLSHAQRPRRRGDRARLTARSERAALEHADAPRPVPEMLLPPAHTLGGLHRSSGRTASRNTPINHHVADPEPPRIEHRDRAGRPRAPDPHHQRAPRPAATVRLTPKTSTDKEPQRRRRELLRHAQEGARPPPLLAGPPRADLR